MGTVVVASLRSITGSPVFCTSDGCPSLRDVVQRSYVLCHDENVSPLVEALATEKLTPVELRASYGETELSWARSTRTFLSHVAAWRRAAENDGYTLVCESDFVPCLEIGSFPVFWPLSDPLSWGYLYQGSPRLLARLTVSGRQYLRGHCAPLVCYVINGSVARIFLDFFAYEMSCHDPREYFTFDAHLQWWTMGRGATAFFPMGHYGEHGGRPNPEHAENRIPRAGRHRADNLAGRLHFLPEYARGSRLRYQSVRIAARTLGFARLLTGRWIVDTNVYRNAVWEKTRMWALGAKRLLA